MTLPAYLKDGDRYAHGTRARYNTKCRCDACTKASRDYELERQAKQRAAAAQVLGETRPAPQMWTTPSGEVKLRMYKRACIGVNGQPCPHGSHLRKDSSGDICARCRTKLNWNGLVPATEAREHLRALQRAGIGRRSVSAACDIAESTLHAIGTGERKWIRAQANARLLAVDVGAIADHALVPAAETKRLIRELVRLGFRKYDLARRLGHVAAVPSLQFNADFVLAKTALRVAKLHAVLFAGEREDDADEDCVSPDEYERPRYRLPRALRWFDEPITMQDLGDALELDEGERDAYAHAMGRLVETGVVERVGERPPFKYRLRRDVEPSSEAVSSHRGDGGRSGEAVD